MKITAPRHPGSESGHTSSSEFWNSNVRINVYYFVLFRRMWPILAIELVIFKPRDTTDGTEEMDGDGDRAEVISILC